VNFVPIEEKERIGKRRKLANPDELKTVATTRSSTLQTKASFSFDGHLFPRMNLEPEPNIDFHIREAEMPPRVSENPRSPIGTNSSDSLLFDDSIGDEIGEQLVSVNRGHSIDPDKQQRFSQSEKWQRGNEACNSSEPLTDRSSTMPVLHRFTLDDQILAEKERSSELNHSTSNDQRLSPQNILGNRFAGNGYEEPDGQLRFSMTEKVDDGFSENTESCGSNSDLLPQTQKIARQLPPQPVSKKQPAFSTPFRTTTDPQVLEYADFKPTFLPQRPQETVSFFGQSVPTAVASNRANKSYYYRSSPIQIYAVAPKKDEYFSASPSHVSVT
jgi:hypothetical protein